MKYYHDNTYLDLVADVLDNGVEKTDRTGTGTISVFGRQMRFNLEGGSIPLLTTKKMHTRSIIHEILWYLQGDTNVKYLQDNGVRIWNEWADDNGDLGPVYGAQWRRWPKYEIVGYEDSVEHVGGQETFFNAKVKVSYIDQIAEIINTLRHNSDSRRIIVNAWNVADINDMALPPCHYAFQFWVADNKLSCMLNQRSCDTGLGVPFNIVQYSILTHMIAHVTGLEPGEFIWSGGDVHIYKNHIAPLNEQILRDASVFPSPTLVLNSNVKEIDDFTFDDFEIIDYESHPTIKMEVSV